MSEHATGSDLPRPQHETGDIGPRFMFLLLAFIGVTLLLMIGVTYLLFPRELADHRFAQPFPRFPVPRLQVSPPTDMRAFYQRELQILNSTGWRDRAAGKVHIPIDQAMREVAAKGIQGWPATPYAAPEPAVRP